MADEHQHVARKVTEALGAAHPRIEAQVVEAFVKREVDKRADALVKVMDLLTATKRELNKCGPDNVAYDHTGAKTHESYSKKRIDEMDKLRKKIGKIEKALNKALENSDYGELYNFASGKAPTEDQSGDSD